MIPIASEAKRLLGLQYVQEVEITLSGVSSDDFKLTQKDIMSGGLTINRYCVSGNKVEIGSAVASELVLTLDNLDGRFDNVAFEGAELYVQLKVKKWDAHRWENAQMYYIPLGYFTIDEAPRKLEVININALDRMMMFDKDVDWSKITFPITASALLTQICVLCNVTLSPDTVLTANSSYQIDKQPESEENITYRQLISWIGEITGTCAFVDYRGHLVLKWYSSTSNETLTTRNRFESDLSENAIVITGIQAKRDDITYLVGTDNYALNIEENALLQENIYDVITNLYNAIGGFEYIPFTATVTPMPYLFPLDKISFVDKNGNVHYSYVTNITFVMNQNTSLQAQGETATNDGYAKVNPLTQREKAIINSMINKPNAELNLSVQNAIGLTNLITNALGVYSTEVNQSDGSTIHYIHNLPTLEESNVIFTMTSEGIAWTNQGWNDGSPVWTYGTTSAGDAFFRLISAQGINVSSATSDYRIEITPSAFNIYYLNQLVTSVQADTLTIPRAKVLNYIEVGKVRIIPYSEYNSQTQQNEVTGTNIVYID